MDDPDTREAITHDYSVDMEWPLDERIYYVAAFIDGEIGGLFIGVPRSKILGECHISIKKNFREYTQNIIKEALKWVRENTIFMKLVGEVAMYNIKCIRCMMKAGFKLEGVNTNSIVRGGVMYDQVYLGLEV